MIPCGKNLASAALIAEDAPMFVQPAAVTISLTFLWMINPGGERERGTVVRLPDLLE